VLLSVTFGTETSIQIGLAESGLKKLHSFLVAAEAACSKGDLPVAAVDAKLVAVIGLAAAAVATAPPAELAAAELDAPIAAIGAAQPCKPKQIAIRNGQVQKFKRDPEYSLTFLTDNIKNPGCP
jgi:hypothetical protein